MAKVDNNVILNNASGTIGDQVVIRRQGNGEAILALPPRRNKVFSAKQKEQQDRFRVAAIYATAAQNNPEYIVFAKRRGLSRFIVAMKDFLTPPEILGIDVTGYSGAAGQVIRIRAIDDVKVKTVSVHLAEDDKTAIENGLAVPDPADPHVWVYTATSNAPSAQVAISVDVTDLAGQVASGAAHT